ncbi:KGG domain-containing protein [Cohnella sp. GCM10012308]|uniref:KGG domain-containing protein n=1 Tax=Cohnella sp. GCM10012308 TaxID=3317329 RepID=UPI003608CC2E
MARNDDNKMSREEAGRMGGEATSRAHDRDFYQEIGEKGGEARGGSNNRSQSDDRDGMSREEAGRKGGRS